MEQILQSFICLTGRPQHLNVMVLEKIPECKIKPVNPKGNQPWIATGRTDVEAETPIVWPLNTKSRLTGQDPDVAKDWRQEEKGMTEDGMVRWHHNSMDMSLSKLWRWCWTGKPGMLQSMGSQSQTQLSNWKIRVHYSVSYLCSNTFLLA